MYDAMFVMRSLDKISNHLIRYIVIFINTLKSCARVVLTNTGDTYI